MAAGLLDDRKPMPARLKVLLQFIAAGPTARRVRVLAGVYPLPLSWLLTTLWIVTVINAVNFFYNMDGLAGGTGLIALVFIIIAAGCRGQHFVTTLASATAGATAAFLCFNRPPATIFMGDSGSHFLGYLVASGCLLTTFYYPEASPTAAPVLIPVILLAVPLLDAVTVVCIRLRLHQPVYVGDNRHISHRFVHLGLSRPQAVLLVCLLSFITGVGALCLLWLPNVGAALVLLQTLAMMAVILIIQFRGHLPEKTEPK
jgi:UDP-GlcNAc:undecaprenyl-phosphate GlcNAc-1-phosphate transferase